VASAEAKERRSLREGVFPEDGEQKNVVAAAATAVDQIVFFSFHLHEQPTAWNHSFRRLYALTLSLLSLYLSLSLPRLYQDDWKKMED